MFEELRKEIWNLTEDRRFPFPNAVSRTVVFVASPSMFHLKDWVETWFPLPGKEIPFLYPWILAEDDEQALEQTIKRHIRDAHDFNRAQRITEDGVAILDTVNQVITIGDLCDEACPDRVSRGLHFIRDAAQEVAPGSQFVWIGAFLVGRNRPAAKGTDAVAAKDAENVPAVVRAGSAAMGRLSGEFAEQFHRTFLFDVSNPQGTFVSQESDQHCLLGHLLYFLSTYPIVTGQPDEYVQWLNAYPSRDGYVSSASAFSLVLPVDQILEAVCALKASEVLREATLKEPSAGSEAFYLDNFRQENRLLTLGEVARSVSEDIDYPLVDPTADLPVFSETQPEGYLLKMDALDASLPRVAAQNGAAISAIAKKRLLQCKTSLEEHIDSITAQEPGGLMVAGRFVSQLQEHVKALEKEVSGQARPLEFSDASGLVARIKQIVGRCPRREAVYARAALLAGAADVAIYRFPLEPVTQLALLALVPLAGLFLAWFSYRSYRQDLENKVMDLERLIRQKWDALMATKRLKAAQTFARGLQDLLKGMPGQLGAAQERIQKLADYFRDEYTPPEPQAFAFWKNVIDDREELLQQHHLCTANVASLARDYLKDDQPLRLWRRLASPGSKGINAWEAGMVEKAGLRVLPYCVEILNLDVVAFLKEESTRFKAYKRALIRGAQPFLVPRPEAKRPELHAVLEADDRTRQTAVQELRRGLEPHFNNFRSVGSRSSYRLSFFGFQEGLKVEDVLLEKGD